MIELSIEKALKNTFFGVFDHTIKLNKYINTRKLG